MSTATATVSAMPTASMPTASAITNPSEQPLAMEFPSLDQLIPSIRQMDILALLKTQKVLAELQKVISVETEKRWKTAEKEAKKTVKKPKKVGSMPKGVLPPQFRKPNAWKAFVLKHARENGWPEFQMNHTYKDKETGEKKMEEITLSASVKSAEGYQYPEGRVFNEKDAMSLSKFYWDSKKSEGAREDLYRLFESTYVEEAVALPKDASAVALPKDAVPKDAVAAAVAAPKEQDEPKEQVEVEKPKARTVKKVTKSQ